MRIEVLTSGIWQTNSTLIASGGACVVVDPAYFPRELDAIAARARELGELHAIAFTHGHWDHVMGHAVLPAAFVWLSSTLDRSITQGDPRAARYLDEAREFDSRWYVPRPGGHRWPEHRRGVGDGDELVLGGVRMRALHLPGHSPDGLGLVAGGTLLVGDYLSPCEIPFVDDAPAYLATLERLDTQLASGEVRDVIPGHGAPLSAADALAIARADRDYVARLIEAPDRAAALAVAWPRAHDVVGMRDHHLDNVAKRWPG
jgi:hydroxyacylglutathione hydrolase